MTDKVYDIDRIIRVLENERECVSRDCDRDCGKCDLVLDADWILSAYDDAIALLKEQEPNVSKYQYKYDHTDCVWYRDSRSRCPVTCSQYRDGWNDAMKFIFKDGPGYNPYERLERK